MVSTLQYIHDSGSLNLSQGWGHCVIFFGKTIYTTGAGNCEEELPKKPVGRQLTDRLPTVYRQLTNRLPTG